MDGLAAGEPVARISAFQGKVGLRSKVSRVPRCGYPKVPRIWAPGKPRIPSQNETWATCQMSPRKDGFTHRPIHSIECGHCTRQTDSVSEVRGVPFPRLRSLQASADSGPRLRSAMSLTGSLRVTG